MYNSFSYHKNLGAMRIRFLVAKIFCMVKLCLIGSSKISQFATKSMTHSFLLKFSLPNFYYPIGESEVLLEGFHRQGVLLMQI
jgi:hypothetical protein